MRVAVLLGMLASCYQPSERGSCTLSCEPLNQNTDCPTEHACVDRRCVAAGETCTPMSDAAIDVPTGCVITMFLGMQCAPGGVMPVDRQLSGPIDTTGCAVEGGVIVDGTCLLFTSSLIVQDVRATGDKPLVLISLSTMSLEGTLDVGSYATQGTGAGAKGGCVVSSRAGMDGLDSGGNTFGGGGGAGGSYQGLGGAGGDGEQSDAPVSGGPVGQVQPFGLRGGCSGGSGGQTGETNVGAGVIGNGGGVVYLIARNTISMTSATRILAGGAGGGRGGIDAGGGGGGGSGGTILLETPQLAVSGGTPFLCATGGGGGGGAEGNMNGAQGADACLNGTAAAMGGPGGSMIVIGGSGGAGASVLAGVAGQSSEDGGGGGGGGAGYILVFGGADISGLGSNISPPVSGGG